MTYIKKQHPYRETGFYLEFPNGHIWSCVNLEDVSPGIGIGDSYDTMGGRYEAMIVNGNWIDGDHQVRAHSMEDLFVAVEKYENDLKNFKS